MWNFYHLTIYHLLIFFDFKVNLIAVEYNGKKYVAVLPTTLKVPGTQEGNPYWKSIGGDNVFYMSENAPINVNVGDRWYVPSTSILYTYIQEETNRFWVELWFNRAIVERAMKNEDNYKDKKPPQSKPLKSISKKELNSERNRSKNQLKNYWESGFEDDDFEDNYRK